MQLFERATEGRGIPRPLSSLNIFPGLNPQSKKPETSNSDNNPSSIDISHMTTSTPLQLASSKSSSFQYWNAFQKKNTKKMPTHHFSSDNLHAIQLRQENGHNFQFQQPQPLQQQHSHHQLYQHKPMPSTSSQMASAVMSSNSDEKKKDMQKVFHDLDTFIEKELNEIQVRKRIGQLEKTEKAKEVDKNSDEKFYATLRTLKDEVREIKENQKEFEHKIQRHTQMHSNLSSTRKKLEYGTSSSIESIASSVKKKDSSSSISVSSKGKMRAPPPPPPRAVQYTKITVSPPKKKEEIGNLKEKISELPLNICNEDGSDHFLGNDNERSREEKISRLETELYKAETLMMKINRVLENVGKVDEHNIDSIINIERHYLVASTRFQSALGELRKINENVEAHHAPFNRKGKLVIREIMLEVKSAYFQRKIPTKNEFLLVMIKYDDRVMASNAIRISNDVRIVRFPDCFSIPEAYADFEMRLEIFGTTFWRKTNTVRETMLKKYGFVTFTLADTGKKHKRFNMIEVMQAENVPIRSKVLMRITQKITAGVQYRGLLFVKIRDTWYETSTHLNGHILEISFKSYNHSSVTQSRETILLDLYNFDSDAVIPVDTRVSKRPNTFSLKFNHYVDVANF